MRKCRFLSSVALAATLVVGWSIDAFAQTPVSGYAINRFDPSQRGSRWFTLESLDYNASLVPALGVVGDAGWREARMNDRAGKHFIVEDQVALHAGASWTLFSHVRLDLSLPIYLHQAGQTIHNYEGAAYFAPAGNGVGDLRIGLNILAVGGAKDAFRLALGGRLWAPTGKAENYTGDGEVSAQGHLDIAGDVGAFAYSVRGGYRYRKLHETYRPTNVGDQIPFGLALGLKFADDALLVGPELQGAVEISDTGRIFDKKTVPLYGILGAHYSAGDFQFGVGVGPGLSSAAGTAVLRGMASIEFVPQIEIVPLDSDNDGIPDDKDACKNEPGVASPDPAKNGCPPDKDGDGIVDANDACPEVAGVADADPKKNGCPPVLDKDGDGIVDAEDACPEVAGVKNDDPKKNGCPPDRDGDGIVDAEDACPEVVGVKSEDPKKNGCPADTDGDGIVDAQDACPNDPGPKNEDPKRNGCPAVVVAEGHIKIFEQVKFKTNSAVILKESDGILDAVAQTLAAHAEIKKVLVEGHTDNVGKPAANKTLSKKRAAAVMAALVKRSIDKGRLQSDGYGQDRPIDTNETDAGRQNNRRVEFLILDPKPAEAQPGGATSAPAPAKP